VAIKYGAFASFDIALTWLR